MNHIAETRQLTIHLARTADDGLVDDFWTPDECSAVLESCEFTGTGVRRSALRSQLCKSLTTYREASWEECRS